MNASPTNLSGYCPVCCVNDDGKFYALTLNSFFRRSLPGLGFSFTFVGLILQLVHDLNKNVYPVNPRHDSNGSSLSGSSSGFVIVFYNV